MGDTSSSSSSARTKTTLTEPLSNLHQPNRFITTHNAAGQAIVHTHEPFTWQAYDDKNLAFAVPYTTSRFPPDLNNDADLKAHERVMASGTLGLVNPRGTVLRCVDFAPGYACGMHRTQSLDYGIVMEGELDMVLDSGECYTMRRGDVAVQRATQHQWVNRSQTEWARMMFVLQDCEKLVVEGKEMREDLGTNSGLPPSGN
ncbi:Cupin type-2 domain-containing protein [Madurella fahalii]|uniref:Cupin type-2 domain-containing protein n=1 Tax=Madurella fahalii TaxID=1157608 RepID=A0ABQ0GCT5_9PEZI